MSVSVAGNPYGAGVGVDGYTNNFIPAIWSGKLQVKFYESTMLADVTNNDWEGEIKNHGDTVNIRIQSDVVVRPYQKHQDLEIQVPQAGKIQLNIDKGAYFNVFVDDVDKAQTDLALMDQFTSDASEKMKIYIERDVFANSVLSAAATNRGLTAGAISGNINLGAVGSPLALNPDTALDILLRFGQVLDEANVPKMGRFVVIPSWMHTQLLRSDLKMAQFTGDASSVVRTGKAGDLVGMTVYVSNLLPQVTDLGADGQAGGSGNNADTQATYVFGGTKDAITFASQITNVDKIKSEKKFGEFVRGLNVYGFEVVKPEAMVVGYVRQA
jgi:hypothetical protein